jgi:hypothetical protein
MLERPQGLRSVGEVFRDIAGHRRFLHHPGRPRPEVPQNRAQLPGFTGPDRIEPRRYAAPVIHCSRAGAGDGRLSDSGTAALRRIGTLNAL